MLTLLPAKYFSTHKKGLAAAAALLSVSLLLVFASRLQAQQYSSNKLATGREAKAAACSLNINLPTDLNFKSRAEVIEARRRVVYEHPELLSYQYTATPSIFENIEDGKPWCGLEGDMFYGPGEKAILGGSEETRFLNNPYILVAANINVSRFAFNDNKYANAEEFIHKSGVPTYLLPEIATFDARACRQELTYKVSNWLSTMERLMETKFRMDEAPFDLVAYNARDLGYNFIQVDSRYTKNIKKDAAGPVQISQYIHCGNSCGYAGGCNNMSPYIRELHDLQLSALPAQMVIYLWKQRPGGNTPADFVVTINFI